MTHPNHRRANLVRALPAHTVHCHGRQGRIMIADPGTTPARTAIVTTAARHHYLYRRRYTDSATGQTWMVFSLPAALTKGYA